jgi:hypothetical protein
MMFRGDIRENSAAPEEINTNCFETCLGSQHAAQTTTETLYRRRVWISHWEGHPNTQRDNWGT